MNNNEEFVVSTIYIKNKDSRPVTHVFGPTTKYKAGKLRKRFLEEVSWFPNTYFYHFSVNHFREIQGE